MLTTADWAIWLDADEFLNVACGDKQVKDLIAAVGLVDAVTLCWRIFGSGGRILSDHSSVLDSFTKAAPLNHRYSRCVKTLFRMSEKIEDFYIHRPIWHHSVQSLLVVDASGRVIDGDFLTEVQSNGNPIDLLPRKRQTYEFAQINHYMVKAIDRIALKASRGDGAGDPKRFGLNYLWHYDVGSETDTSIQRHLTRTRALMAEAMEHALVAFAFDTCRKRFAQRLAAIAPATQALAAAWEPYRISGEKPKLKKTA